MIYIQCFNRYFVIHSLCCCNKNEIFKSCVSVNWLQPWGLPQVVTPKNIHLIKMATDTFLLNLTHMLPTGKYLMKVRNGPESLFLVICIVLISKPEFFFQWMTEVIQYFISCSFQLIFWQICFFEDCFTKIVCFQHHN